MTTSTPEPDWTDDGENGGGVVAIVDDDSPRECTLFPSGADNVDLLSSWITARGDAFVSLDSIR